MLLTGIEYTESQPQGWLSFFFHDEALIRSEGKNPNYLCLYEDGVMKTFAAISERRLPALGPAAVWEHRDAPQDVYALANAIGNDLDTVKLYGVPYCPVGEALSMALQQNPNFVYHKEEEYYLLTAEDFKGGLHPHEKQRLQAATDAGVIVKKNAIDFSTAYRICQTWAGQKNYLLSMSEAQWQRQTTLKPEQYHIFTAHSENNIIAINVVLAMTSGIFYSFYPYTNKAYAALSPMVMLHQEAHSYALKHGFSIYALGTAHATGMVNNGLKKFKENLGCRVTYRHIFERRKITNGI